MAKAISDYHALLDCGLPKGYASEISRGLRRPSLKLALEIYRKCGRKVGPLKNARAGDIPALERAVQS